MITKTEFMHHEECPIWLWLAKNRPDLIPPVTPEVQRRFDTGNEVDAVARQLYPHGYEISGYNERGAENTQDVMRVSNPDVMYQPTAVTKDGLTSRADILTRGKNDTWDIREVKSSTDVKEEHVVDMSFQRICFEDAGFNIGKTYLVHINNKYVREGDLDPQKLFTQEDITKDVLAAMKQTRLQIEEAKKIIAHKDAPDALLVQKCTDPKRCEHLEYYVHGFPEIHALASSFPDEHVLALLKRGVLDPAQIPAAVIARVGYEPEQPYKTIDAEGIRAEVEKLKYPLCYFDYETFWPAVPPFDGCWPYRQMPFQYSLHVRRSPDAPLEHFEFLARAWENPMPTLLAQLASDMPKEGTVIVWNAGFEGTCNKQMAAQYPEHAQMLDLINDRMWDLMMLFKGKNKMYEDSDFQKSASLKKVLPVICPDLDYSNLEIQEGGEASSSWPMLAHPETTDAEKEKLARNMLAYCGRDTEAMVCILDHLIAQSG